MNSINVWKIKNGDEHLDYFLRVCIPSKLRKLSMNYTLNSTIPTKAKFYLSSLSKAIRSVTNEVYFKNFEFNEKDLEYFIRTACNVEAIAFNFCSIHCSTKMDFGENIKYKTKTLSFKFCGNMKLKNVTTDWKTNPSAFLNIIDAIGKSELRQSLTKIDISSNETLDKANIKEYLDVKNMAHILID